MISLKKWVAEEAGQNRITADFQKRKRPPPTPSKRGTTEEHLLSTV
jgi:hypothetical protein